MRRMTHAWWIVGAMFAASCNPSEVEFSTAYTEAYCSYFLDCTDPAVLVFDGLDTIEECRAIIGPDISAHVSNCKLHRSVARRCLEQMEALTCPDDVGTPIDDVLPADCELSWKKCTDLPEDDAGDDEQAR